jgi:hypothetical protein
MLQRRWVQSALLVCALASAGCGHSSPAAPAFGAAAKLEFSVIAGNQVAGTLLNPGVQVAIEDAQGNVVTTATANVTIAMGSNPANGSLTGATTVAAVSGYAVFSTLMLSQPGLYALNATASGLTGSTSNTFSVVAHSATVR